MIIDYLDSSAASDIDADLCIIGAGAAGIAIARHFIGTSITVCLIEGGGATGEEQSQALYEGISVGTVPFDAGTSRMRVFGGSCNLWGGGCIPLGPHDLAERHWVAHSGWPIAYDELQPYYERARAYCQIEPYHFTDGSFLTSLARAPISFDADKLVNQIFARSPILFGKAYRAELEKAPNITVLLHANLLELHASASGASVRHARIGAVNGRKGVARAQHYVLACGGIENARMLLLSNSVLPHGLGNENDLVGRYFMDHPCGSVGTVITNSPERLTRPYDRNAGKGLATAFPEIGLSHAFQAAHRILNGRVHPFAVEDTVPKGIQSLRDFRAALRPCVHDENAMLEARLCAALKNAPANGEDSREHSANVAMLALRVGLGSMDIAKALLQKLRHRPTVRSNRVELMGYFEQAPNPDSRITLANERDILGLPKVCIDWRLTALDRHTYRTAAALFGTELAQACGGIYHPAAWLSEGDNVTAQVHTTAHHLGATRMADDPRHGVVDPRCRVHGVENLHVAGSSVFPTGGWAFPTFTVVALALRLADQLRALMRATALSEAI
ncbi:GMC family oxidoreductase [Dyella monticola]|uniref:GMC family oxidoreductase n=1 Tax=Dyella monticola TaxID=1927958 RepID=A0A370X5W8_9GAMM|nr:GMC oxidoreductase [Dyella monticola]RDS83641.1 GMC family oxidoreductase [Dyella monticola]